MTQQTLLSLRAEMMQTSKMTMLPMKSVLLKKKALVFKQEEISVRV
jgi:hypothetical protein